jgi:APA family basic amino acid/polyamine antiporter
MSNTGSDALPREIGMMGAVLLGLGSMIGTGVFVSLGIAAGIAGAGVVLALALAALVATCNGLSSAQLAANHPVSGGTYEYGYRYLNPWLGFAAGWMFLCAKTASAATAAIGFAGYLLNATGGNAGWLAPVAVATVVVFTAVVLAGIRLSSRVNAAIVSATLLSLAAFVVGGLPAISADNFMLPARPSSVLHATALLFVAYTGYGRIATLGEEVRDPRTTIPRAIIATLVLSMVVYVAVAVVAVGAAGAERLSQVTADRAAPLEIIARGFPLRVHWLVAAGAITAMLGVLLNLLLGLSRVLLAMGRRGDMPKLTARLPVAVLVTGIAIGGLAATGNVKTTWSFSAFTVLIYYAVTNLAALRLRTQERMYSRLWAGGGLAACLLLAFSIEWVIWAAGTTLLAAGLLCHGLRRRWAMKRRPQGKRE